jgi:hypothetical protein
MRRCHEQTIVIASTPFTAALHFETIEQQKYPKSEFRTAGKSGPRFTTVCNAQETQALSRSQVLKSCSCDLGSDKSNSEAWKANSMTV